MNVDDLSVAGMAERVLGLLEKEGGRLSGEPMLETLERENPTCRFHPSFALLWLPREGKREGKAKLQDQRGDRDPGIPENVGLTELFSRAFVSTAEATGR
jgi:hypothetical protein